jgi:uncharacterized protein YfdQ (DUF2303 family)
MNLQAHATEVDSVVDALKDLKPVHLTTIEGLSECDRTREILVVRDGYSVHDVKPFLDEYLTAPERRKGTASLDDLPSFIAFVKRFADKDSAVFADRSIPTKPALEAVIDYHRQSADGEPRFGQHRARYDFPLSEEWLAWTSQNGKVMGQSAFAAFVEGRLADLDGGDVGQSAQAFADKVACEFASPSKLIALSRGLTVREDSRVLNATNLSTGETQFVFETAHQTTDKDGGPITVPGAFLIAIPVFRRSAPYQIPVRLRYRKQDHKVVWFYELYRADSVFDHAFDEACELVRIGTELPLFLGRSER